MYEKAKTLVISAKCCNSFCATLINDEPSLIGFYEGDVPDFMPGEHFGDYVQLEIDIETGVIKNWKKPTEKELQNTFESK